MTTYAPLEIGPYWEDLNEHLIELVDLIPEESLNWSPSPREWNFRGTFVHLIGARYFVDMYCDGPAPNPDVLADSATLEGIKRHLRLSWERIAAFLADPERLANTYDIDPGEYVDPPHQTGHYAAYHRFVHDIQHRGDVMRYLEALGIDPLASRRRRPL